MHITALVVWTGISSYCLWAQPSLRSDAELRQAWEDALSRAKRAAAASSRLEPVRWITPVARADSSNETADAGDPIPNSPSEDLQVERVGFLRDDLAAWGSGVRGDLLRNLQSPKLAGMRAYIEREFPDTPAATWQTPSGRSCVPHDASMSFVEKIKGLIALLSDISEVKIDLRVGSAPPNAQFSIVAVGGGRPATTSTDSTLTNFYRGIYSYEVSKAGFKTIRGEVNLVDERGTNLRCRLFSVQEDAGPIACKLGED